MNITIDTENLFEAAKSITKDSDHDKIRDIERELMIHCVETASMQQKSEDNKRSIEVSHTLRCNQIREGYKSDAATQRAVDQEMAQEITDSKTLSTIIKYRKDTEKAIERFLDATNNRLIQDRVVEKRQESLLSKSQ